MIKIQIPKGEEIKRALLTARIDPEDLTDRELWILEEFGGDSQ